MLTLIVEAGDPAALARFWAGMLDREIVDESSLPGGDTQVGLRFVPAGGPSSGPGRPLHLHVTTSSEADRQQTVATALRLGGAHLDVGQLPEETHIVLADPEGNAFCVIEPGNNFLAGCGRLGELACDGTREVGLFWSEALGWPLVWDDNGETAVQSPHGGTKVAWGGPPVSPKSGRNRQRFSVAGVDVERLLALGATRLPPDGDGEEFFADPDGNEFTVES